VTHTSLRLRSSFLVSSCSLLVAAAAVAGCTEVAPGDPDGGPRSIDAFVERDGSDERLDAASDGGRRDGARADGAPEDGAPPDTGTDAPIGCGPDCPRGYCIGGVCTMMPSCCYTGYCAGGLRCDESCTCVPPTGCCAGEACASGEICEEYSCECVRADDCCRVIGCDVGEICNADCSCEVDTSCGAECSGDRFCWYSVCHARCEFDGCPDP
jgi:hypothetical protein